MTVASPKPEPNWEEQVNRTYQTKGYKKLWNYYLDIVKGDYFQNKIKELRAWYQIPENGFKADKTMTFPPEEWKLQHTDYHRKLDRELEKICDKFDLNQLDWTEAIELYLFYNEVGHFHHINAHNLCYLEDVIENTKEPFSDELTKNTNTSYPLAIRVSPYASQRDIIDWVKKMAPIIESHLKTYRKPEIKIGKTKAKKAEQRDEFIYQNRDKKGKEIKRLVQEKFGDNLAYEYIPKIISREKKKRQKV